MIRSVQRNAIILGLFAIATAAALAITNAGTLDRIRCNKQAALQSSLHQVMPAALFDNSLLADVITVNDALLGRGAHHIYRARRQGDSAGAVMEATAADGYGGSLSLLIGVNAEGIVQGVRVVPPHNETPGLGDKVELKKSDWVLSFNGKSLDNPEQAGWAVKKDGGVFDSFTGATITPRAVVGQTLRALQYYRQHHAEIFDQAAEAVTTEHCND